MGWAQDTIQEYKKLPPAGKIGVGVVVVGVAGFAVYSYLQSKNSTSTTPSLTGGTSTGSSDAGSLMGGLQSPYGQVPTTAGNGVTVPIVPTGVNPLFDALGNLIGWQQQAPTTTVTPPPTTTTTTSGGTTKTPTPTPIAAKSNNPIIPYNTFANHKFPTQPGKPGTNVTTYSYGGTTYNVHPGAEGRVYGQPVKGGASVLLYAPSTYYSKSGTGSGGESMFSYMNNPLQYLQGRTPHVTAVHPRAS
jgi:hypothetical protein